jgi:hypothetical protein
MNAGSLLVMIKLLSDIEKSGGLIGPPAPNGGNGNGDTTEIKPDCGPGEYAYKVGDFWVCRTIPGGR